MKTQVTPPSTTPAIEREQVRAKIEEQLLAKLKEQGHDLYIFRKPAAKIIGLSPRTCANLDSRGEGPEKIMIGGRVAYLTPSFVAFMVNRIQPA